MLLIRRFAFVLAIGLAFSGLGCGGDGPTTPSGSGSSGSGSSGSGSSGSRYGTLSATVDGVAYTFIVNLASYQNGVLNVATNNAALTLSVSFATRAGVGTSSLATGQTTMSVITTNGSTVTGAWGATNAQGSGSLTITALTSTGASGTFNFNAPPAPAPSNAGATGTKVVTNGAFTVTF